MPLVSLLAFIFFGSALISPWLRRDPRVWGTLFSASLLCAFLTGHLNAVGLLFTGVLTALWGAYMRKSDLALFILLILFSLSMKMHFLPGFTSYFFTPHFCVGLDAPLIGLFPLVFLVPLSKSKEDWTQALRGFLYGTIGIAIIALLATATKATHWNFKTPSFFLERLVINFFLTCIPEEAFYRGFLQNTLCKSFQSLKYGKFISLLLTSIIFTAAHVFWSPNFAITAFVFLASLLYGGVYLISGRIESAILTHFLLNAVHMTFFSYHAM
jgi:uncharacterized protein